MDGVLLVRKPEGLTSHDVVSRLRRILGIRRIGHFGTLDPFATGLLVAGLGQATRLSPFLSSGEKAYEGRIRLGESTDTYDRTGAVTRSSPPGLPDEAAVRAAMDGFQGEQSQLPPLFSAKKRAGRPLYAYARKGQDVERRPSPVIVFSFVLKAYGPPDLLFEVRCSAGTYVRSLAHDLGARLGCGAHLADLVRTASGSFRLADAISLEIFESLAREGRAGEAIVPLERLLPDLPMISLTPEGVGRVRNGRPVGPGRGLSSGTPSSVVPSPKASPARLFSPEGRLVALARPGDGEDVWAPFIVLI
jgi:tRNA pseudouridine55 synthase